MRNTMSAAVLSMTLCLGISACVADEPTDDVDLLSEQQQHVEVCSAAYGCVLTAIRDENYWLIDTCIAVLCVAQE